MTPIERFYRNATFKTMNTITVNGNSEELACTTSVLDLLARHQLKPELVAVEINEHVVPKKTYETRNLEPGDRVEIVHFVGGG